MHNCQWQQQANQSNNGTGTLFFEFIRVTFLNIILFALLFTHTAIGEEKAKSDDGAKLYHSPSERRDMANMELMDGVVAGILLEAEAGYSKQGDEKNSDAVLATFEFTIDAELTDGVSGRLILLWEEDDTEPLDMDEGYITLGNTEKCPLYLRAGKMYLPFGAFNSHFVSDPLILELAETRKSAVMFGFARGILDANVCIFNGNMDEDADDTADNSAVSITLTPHENINIGAFWISDIGESEVMEELITANMSLDETLMYRESSGAGAFISLSAGCLNIEIEYITALDKFTAGIVSMESQKPSALNTELSLHCFESWEIAVKYETSKDFPDFPEDQYGIVASYLLNDFSTISIEYLRGSFAGETPDRDMITAQLAMEF